MRTLSLPPTSIRVYVEILQSYCIVQIAIDNSIDKTENLHSLSKVQHFGDLCIVGLLPFAEASKRWWRRLVRDEATEQEAPLSQRAQRVRRVCTA